MVLALKAHRQLQVTASLQIVSLLPPVMDVASSQRCQQPLKALASSCHKCVWISHTGLNHVLFSLVEDEPPGVPTCSHGS